MSGAAIPEADLSTLLEAARWAPSSYNAQPWRILYALRDDESWPRFLDLLDEANRDWAQDAGALLVFVSRTAFERNGRPSLTHSFDAGAAWENLALQGTLLGWAVHGMEGFDYDRARADLAIPDLYQVEMMAAVGRARDPEELGDAARRQERPSGRKPLAAIAFRGTFPSGLS
jgi:nitroreductase